MTLKLLFDECVGKPIIQGLDGVLRLLSRDPLPEFSHVIDHVGSGTADEDWIPRVASQGWIVVSADRGKRCKGGKLPEICRAFFITHILLSAKLHEKNNFKKACALLYVWDDILLLPDCKKGSRHSLRYTGDRHVKLLEIV